MYSAALTRLLSRSAASHSVASRLLTCCSGLFCSGGIEPPSRQVGRLPMSRYPLRSGGCSNKTQQRGTAPPETRKTNLVFHYPSDHRHASGGGDQYAINVPLAPVTDGTVRSPTDISGLSWACECTIVSAKSFESRPSRCAVAYASLDTSAMTKSGQLRGGRGRSRARGEQAPGAEASRGLSPPSHKPRGGTGFNRLAGHTADPDLRIRTPAHSLDGPH